VLDEIGQAQDAGEPALAVGAFHGARCIAPQSARRASATCESAGKLCASRARTRTCCASSPRQPPSPTERGLARRLSVSTRRGRPCCESRTS
jgi:hypothetical protein